MTTEAKGTKLRPMWRKSDTNLTVCQALNPQSGMVIFMDFPVLCTLVSLLFPCFQLADTVVDVGGTDNMFMT